MPLTKFFRIGVEGATVDGRTIDRSWIADMAAGYNRETCAARINCEHIAGFSPEPPFNSYGTVHALKAEEITLQIDGKPVKKLALLAQLDANEQLLAINAKGQKIFTSMEIAPNFAATGKAGLVGLAVTDNPASLGTEQLEFAAKATVNPLAARKQHKDNHSSAAEEASIELDAPPVDESKTIVDGLKAFFASFTKPEPATPPAPVPPVDQPANDNITALTAAMTAGFGKMTEALAAVQTQLTGQVTQLRTDFDKLQSDVESTDGGGAQRPAATGGAGDQSKYAKIDC